MKRTMLMVIAGLCCALAFSEEGYRIFTDAIGRAVSARILTYDARNESVLVQMEDGRQGRIPLSELSEDDKTYIRAWNNAQGFVDERQLRIQCRDVTVEKTKEEVREDFTWSGGDVMENFLMNVITHEKIAYEFELSNRNATPLSGIRMEYRIYYEQSELSLDGIPPEAVQKRFSGNAAIDILPARERVKIQTKPVEIHKDSINEIDMIGGDPRRGGEGEVHGIRARFYMKLSTGDELMREFHYPDSLSEQDYPWR